MERFLKIGATLSRPADVISVVGDATKAHQILGWAPTTTFEEMIKAMVAFDLEKLDSDRPERIWKPG